MGAFTETCKCGASIRIEARDDWLGLLVDRSAPEREGWRDKHDCQDEDSYDSPCDYCGCALSRCKQAPDRFGTERCCTHCDHEDDR